jgi:hypothetical protein
LATPSEFPTCWIVLGSTRHPTHWTEANIRIGYLLIDRDRNFAMKNLAEITTHSFQTPSGQMRMQKRALGL